MARKRITEAEFIDFEKHARKRNFSAGEKRGRAEKQGILLIQDAAITDSDLKGFASKIKERGFLPEVVDLSPHNRKNRPHKIPQWQSWLALSQEGYQKLSGQCEKVIVLGTGLSTPVACVIAEQFPAEGLVIVGGGLKKEGIGLFAGGIKGTSFQLARFAKNNLFSVVCPVLALVPSVCSPYSASSAVMYRLATRSENVRIQRFPGTDVSDIWTKCEDKLLEEVEAFFVGD